MDELALNRYYFVFEVYFVGKGELVCQLKLEF